MEISIRIATFQDADTIAEFSRRTFYEAFAPFNADENMKKFMATEFETGRLVSQVGEPGNTFLLAFANHGLAGYARLLENASASDSQTIQSIELSRIYVGAQFTSQGVGARLMENCFDIARMKDKKAIWLGVWENNLRAILFYERLGFRKCGEHIFMLGDDPQKDYLMEKAL